MGFFSNVANRVRQAWTSDKEQIPLQLAKGATMGGHPESGYDLLNAYGYDVLGDYLRLEQDLLSRYIDYEEMDDYPEISAAVDIFADDACITGDTEIPLLDGRVATVDELYARDAQQEWVYSFDPVRKQVVPGIFDRVVKIADSLPVFRVTYRDRDGNVGVIRATADHKFLMLSGKYKRVRELSKGDRLMALFKLDLHRRCGSDNPRSPRNDVVLSVEPAGEEAIYDLVNALPTHNFAAGSNGRYVFVKNTQPDTQLNRTVWVTSPDKNVQTTLDDLFNRRLRIDEEIWEIARTLVKYGNDFEELLVTPQGVMGLNFLPPPTVRRIEGPRGELFGFIQDFQGRFGFSPEEFKHILAKRTSSMTGAALPGDRSMQGLDPSLAALEDWEVVHFRMRGKHRRSIYGFSTLEAARWIWKRLLLLEDSALIYRLQRAPERFAFYVDVGDLPPAEALAYVNRVRQQYKKKKFVNPATGKLDQKFNPLCLAADTRVPLLDGSVRTISEMAESFARGEEQWVYATDLEDQGKVRPARVKWAGKTRSDAQLLKLTLSNGETLRVTPDHKMITRTGERKQAQHLQPGDSLMPFRRRVSSKAKGEQLEGYELVYCPKTRKSLYGHRIVARDLGLATKNQVVHHQDFDALNNSPRNLVGMSGRDHNRLHRLLGYSAGLASVRARRADPDLDVRLRAASSANIIKWNKSEEHKTQLRERNKVLDQGRFFRIYNASEKHTADNEVRSEAMTAFWADPGKRERSSRAMRLKFPLELVEGIKERIREVPKASLKAIAKGVTSGPLLAVLNAANTRNVRSVHRHMLLQMARSEGYGTFSEFREEAIKDNCKVVAIEWLEECEDTFTLTVEPCHTFAVSAGVFVCNSQDEDFFLPSRQGQDGTRIDVLAGPVWQHMEDIEYFQNKMFSAMKIPKAYLAQDDNTARAVLSTEDVRFARSVLRVQREIVNGLRKICRVHLAAVGMNPHKLEYEVHMTVPSSIFELAQLEVRNARADLAGRMKEFVSIYWVYKNVFSMSDEDIEVVTKQRESDVLDETVWAAKAQAEAEKLAQPEGGGDGGGGGGVPSGMTMGKKSPSATRKIWTPQDPRTPLLRGGAHGISDRELMAGGNREAERRADQKLGTLLKNDKAMRNSLRELQDLVMNLARSTPSSR